MQFSKQIVGALAIVLFSIPALAVQTAKPKQDAAVMNKQLEEYHKVAVTELTDCAKAKSIAHCLARGVDLKGKQTLTKDEEKRATDAYFNKLGGELGQCTNKDGFEVCLARIKNANDDAKLVIR